MAYLRGFTFTVSTANLRPLTTAHPFLEVKVFTSNAPQRLSLMTSKGLLPNALMPAHVLVTLTALTVSVLECFQPRSASRRQQYSRRHLVLHKFCLSVLSTAPETAPSLRSCLVNTEKKEN